MQAIILAAGMGKRLGHLTQDNTKCMIQVNGVTLIERMLRQLDNLSPSLEKIVVVTGYKGAKLKSFISLLDISTPVEYVDNPLYAATNNIYSLYLAKEHLLQDDTLLFESDLIFEDSVIDALLHHPYPSLALVAKFESWMKTTTSSNSFPAANSPIRKKRNTSRPSTFTNSTGISPVPTTSPSSPLTAKPWATTNITSRCCGSSPCWTNRKSRPCVSAAKHGMK